MEGDLVRRMLTWCQAHAAVYIIIINIPSQTSPEGRVDLRRRVGAPPKPEMEGTLPWETPPPDEELPPCDRCQLDHRLAAKRALEEQAYQDPLWRVLLGLRAGKAAWGLEPLDLGCARGDQDESCGYTHGGQSVHHGHGSLRLYVMPRRRRNSGLNVPSTP